jgi:hypothetical protein
MSDSERFSRPGVTFIDIDTCYVIGCPAPIIDHEFYSDYETVDPRHDGGYIGVMTKRVYDPITGNVPIALRHNWHSVGSHYTREESEYILVPSVAEEMCKYELSRVGVDEDGQIYRETSRLETFSLMLAELKHHNLI